MKKIFAALLALCLTFSVFGAFSEDAPVYLALGDSITTGYGLKENEKSFPEIVARTKGYALVNRAVNGNTASGIIEQMKEPASKDPAPEKGEEESKKYSLKVVEKRKGIFSRVAKRIIELFTFIGQ